MHLVNFGSNDPNFNHEAAMNTYKWYMETEGSDLIFKMAVDDYCEDIYQKNYPAFVEVAKRCAEKRIEDIKKSLARGVISKSMSNESVDATIEAVEVIKSYMSRYDRTYDRDKKGRFAEQNTWSRKVDWSGRKKYKSGTPQIDRIVNGFNSKAPRTPLTDRDKQQYAEAYEQIAESIKGKSDVAAVLHILDESTGKTETRRAVGKEAETLLAPDHFTGDKRVTSVNFVDLDMKEHRDLDKYRVASDNYSDRLVRAGEINPYESGTTRNMQRVGAAAQFVEDIPGADKLPSKAKRALAAGKYVGELGPEAERVMGPTIRSAAYRYRGVEKNPEGRLMDSIRQTVAGSINPDDARDRLFHPRMVTHETQYGAEEVAEPSKFLQYWQSRLPDKNLLDLHLNSGAIAPSEGMIFNRQGDVVTQAVGYGDDHYLPFNLKKLSRAKGGEYVRTRTVGGPTTEDIYAGLMSGTRGVTVVSHSGIFTIEFDPEFRGGRRYNDKAARMMERYGKLVDTLDSQTVQLSQIPESRKREIYEQAEMEIPGNTPGTILERKKKAQELMGMEKYNPTPSQETRDEWRSEFLAEEASKWNREGDPMSWDQAKSSVEARAGSRLSDDQAIAELGLNDSYDKYVRYREGQYRQEMSPLTLNGEGYYKALSALKEQFPYYISDVKWTPNTQGQNARDKGYVKAKHLRPAAAKDGYWDRSIEGYSGSIPDRNGNPSGKYRADKGGYANWAAHARLEGIEEREREKKKEKGESQGFNPGGSDAGADVTGTSPAGSITSGGASGARYQGFVQSADVKRGFEPTPFEQVQNLVALREALRQIDVLAYQDRGANRNMSIWTANDPGVEGGNPVRGAYTNLMYGSDEEFLDRIDTDPDFMKATVQEAANMKEQIGRSGWQGALAGAVNAKGILNKFGDSTPQHPTTAYALVRGLAEGSRNKLYDFSVPGRTGAYYLPGLSNREYEAAWKTDPDVARFSQTAEGRFGYQWNLHQDDNKFYGLTKQLGGQMDKGLSQVSTWRKQIAQYESPRNVPNPSVVKYGGKTYSIFGASDLENDIAKDALALTKMRQLKSVYKNASPSPRIPNDVIATEPYHPSLKSGQNIKEKSLFDDERVISLDIKGDEKPEGISQSRLGTGKLKTQKIDESKLEDVRASMDEMVGLRGVKGEFNALIDDARVNQNREAAGLPVESNVNHLIFEGHPGTGKTTVATKLAQAYNALGILPTDKVVVASRADLVGEYSGHTAAKTRRKFDEAQGGVLFIDEAYALKNGPDDSFGKEAIDEIVNLSDQRRKDTVVIMAGYPGDMKRLLSANPGLKSRFPRTINFPNYKAGEVEEIGNRQAKKLEYSYAPEAKSTLKRISRRIASNPESANGRDIRNFDSAVRRAHNARISGMKSLSREDMTTITNDDVKRAEKDYFSSVTKRLVRL